MSQSGSVSVKYTMRWFGPEDPVPLANLRQVPGLDGVVTALSDVPAGVAWTRDQVAERVELLERHGLRWLVVESIPISEDIKTDGPARDAHVEAWTESLRVVAAAGISTVCYNFMPVFDWMRTDFAMPLADGSTAMSYDESALARFDLSRGMERLAAWSSGYDGEQLKAAFARYEDIDERRLREHLASFLRDVTPVAEEVGVRLAIHPDDPPWSIFGLPRIVKDADDLRFIVDAVDSPANGLTFCTGALGANGANDLPAMAADHAERIAFVHARNVALTGPRDFHEVAHHRDAGAVDLPRVMRELFRAGVDVPIRPDHGRMLWGEQAIPGYGLYDRAIGLAYLQGLEHGMDVTHVEHGRDLK
ncbi:MAG TPA: mannonate dehydratase [Trueperaceae bacterium]|nr:mannonate dehydratase [Trueperaceae bacterium]